MNITFIIMLIGSIGFILMGLFILFNKAFKELNPKYVKRNGYINIIMGLIALIISILLFIKPEWNNVLLILYMVNILVLTFIQRSITKKLR